MAEDTAISTTPPGDAEYVGPKTVPFAGGVYRPTPEETVPERGGLGWLRDRAATVGQGIVDVVQSPLVAQRDAAAVDYGTSSPEAQRVQAKQELLSDIRRKIGGLKTETGQAQEEGKIPGDTGVVSTLIDSLPATAAIMASGPAAPITAGVIAHGAQGAEAWDVIRRMPEEELKKNKKYEGYIDQGMSDEDARRAIYADRNTLESLALNVGGNALFAGLGQHILGVGLNAAFKNEVTSMTRRIIQGVLTTGTEGAVGGAALGGGSEWGRQAGEIGSGLRQDRDWGRIGESAWSSGKNLAILGTAAGFVKGAREPSPTGRKIGTQIEGGKGNVTKKILTTAEKLAEKKPIEKLGEVAENTGYVPGADEIGSDLMIVAAGETAGRRPAPPVDRGGRPADAGAADVAQPGTPQGPSTEVTPPGRSVPSEVPPAAVSPKPAVAESPLPVRTTPTSPTEQGAAPLSSSTGEAPTRPVPVPTSPVEPRPVTAEGADVSARPVTEGSTTPVAPADEAAPVAAAPPGEPAKQPMTVEELRARALDLNQSPTVGDLQKHIAEWKAENPGVKLSEQNEILKANREVRQAEVERVKAEKQAAVAEERAAKQQAAEDAKAAKAETAKAKVEAAKAKAEPKAVEEPPRAAPTEEVKPEPTIGEKVKEAVEAPKPVDAEQQLQAAREALAEHDAAVDRKHVGDMVGASLEKRTPEHIAERNRLGQRVDDLEAQTKKAPVAGEKAARAIAGAAAKQQERADLAALQTEKLITKRDKTDVATNQQYERREGQKSEREQAAIKVFGDKSAAIDELKPLHDRIDKARPSQAKEDLQTAQRHIQGIVDGYNSELRNRGLPTLGGKFPDVVSTRAGHGAHHNVMSTLNNLARVLRKTIDTDGTKAKAAALRGLELTRKVREGKVEEVEAERAKAADAESMRRKSVTQGDRTDQIADKSEREEGVPVKRSDDLKALYKRLGVTPVEKTKLVDGVEHVSGQSKDEYVDGVRHRSQIGRVNELSIAGADVAARMREHVLSPDQFAKVGKKMGEKIERTTLGKMMDPFRPKDPVMGMVFDAVRNMVKDMPATVWSANMHAAYHAQGEPGMSRAFYSPEVGGVFIRPDTMVARTVFHEALHAATSRALDGSERLTHLVTRLQDIIEDRFKNSPASRESTWYEKLINRDGERIDPHEFISELFTRDDARQQVQALRLRPEEFVQLKRDGYVPDKGRSILRTLWDEFLKAIGIVPHLEGLRSTGELQQHNAMKIAIDMLQDTFEREGSLRERDVGLGITSIGRYFDMADIHNLAKEDPVGGGGAYNAALRGDHGPMVNLLMDKAERMDGPTADKAIRYLGDVNDMYYEHPPGVHAEMEVTPLSNTEQVKGGVENFLAGRFGESSKMADAGYQIDKRFATPLRHMVQGLRYTNDLGNNLEKGFRDAVDPIKQWWSKREHFAQEYMDRSGANKLIDDIATMKHAIKDRKLWDNFEKLLVRESYTRAFADEELGVGRNSHIDTGSLRDMQTVNDHKANQALMNEIRKADPSGRLIELRNRIHDFEAADLENRKRAQASDMLTRMKIADPSDRVGMLALIRDVRNEVVKMTPEEKTAFDRIVGSDHTSKQFKDYVENRDVIRSVLDQTDKNGPHVPFMRHGNHVVTAKYHVTPTAVGKYHPIDPKADLIKGYAFEDRTDAQNFVKNVLSRDDIQITQTGGREVVYDTRTGEAAKIWTVEKTDGTAKTFENQHDAEQAMEKGDELKSKEITPKDVKQRADDNLPVDHFKTYHTIEFNPQEYTRFDSERAANEYRNRINLDTHDPNFRIDVSNVETPRDIAQRGVASHASSEMKQWVNRVEASPAYQKMTPHEQADWSRELYAEAARVTMMTGRRSINLPREYVKGASTDILKNMIQSTGSSARAIAGNLYNPRIQQARERAQAYTDQYANQTGGEGRNHRARQDVLDEFDRRLNAPIRVDGSWAQGIKRALQVSMISHLADASFLVINAMEPWILGAAITASRHGWVGAYSELAKANALINPLKMAKMAAEESWQAGWKGKYRPADYEGHLLQAVSGQADAKGLSALLNHMFGRGLVSRDTGMEVERIHDPGSNILGRGADRVDATFRGANTGIETLNRAGMGIADFRLEFRRAIKEGKSEAQAQEQAIRYAEDQVFKAAGDYGQWNNPRYFNNPFMKLATQFKKYPLRIASVYADAIIQASRGDKQAMKQVAYMLATQGIAGGALGLPLSPFAGTVNAAYILGLTDNKWSDVEFALRKGMVDRGISPEITDLVLRGALRFTGADFHPRLTQNSMVFFGDPDSRDPTKLAGVVGRTLLGSVGSWGASGIKGFQQLMEAASDYSAGAHDQAWQKGMQGADNIIQIKALHNIVKAFHDMTAGPLGMPKGNETTTGQALMQALGFGPVQLARKQEEKRTVQAAKKYESEHHTIWVNRWLNATSTSNQSAIWAEIQKKYNPTVPPEQRIQYSDLHKAQVRKAKTEKRDDSKLGVPLSGRQKSFADIGKYFATQ